MPLETSAVASLRKWTNQELNQEVKPAVVRRQELPQSRIAWEVLVGVFIIQLSVSSVLASQGIIVSHLLLQSSTNNFGAGCGMAASQCETQVALHSPPGRQGLGLGVSMVAQALAQFVAPLFLVALLAGYGVSGASLIQAALVLHGLAGALDMLQLHTYSSLPQDEVQEWRDGGVEIELQQPEVEEHWDGRLRNHMGVEIMPQILEEEEDDENSLRDSWCPVAPLEIYMPLQEDSTVKGNSPKPLLTPSSLSSVANDVFDFGRSRQCCIDCTSWVGEWCVRLVPLCVASLVPSLAQHGLLLPRHEAAFALAVAGFGWLCAAVCTPCLLTPSAKRQMPLMYAIASGFSALGLFLLSEPGSHDRLTLGCATVGLAHGILVLSCPHLLRRLCSEPELGNIQMCVSRTNALLDRGAALFMLAIALTFGLIAETVWSYGHLLFALAGLQACLGTAWLAWELGNRLNTCWTAARHSNIMRAPTVEILNS
ncbi:hypothetical protein B566_EDAN001980 [Ephemera danica]|nr:hypothetical protein B566_EDAN001980 [Ephemera danica]